LLLLNNPGDINEDQKEALEYLQQIGATLDSSETTTTQDIPIEDPLITSLR